MGAMLSPRSHGLLKGDRPVFILMLREVLPAVGRRPLLRITVQVGCQRSQHGHRALYPHAKMQRAAASPELHPRPEFAQAQVFFCLRDRRAPDSGEDEFVPDLVSLGELFVFPRSLTS